MKGNVWQKYPLFNLIENFSSCFSVIFQSKWHFCYTNFVLVNISGGDFLTAWQLCFLCMYKVFLSFGLSDCTC